MRTMRLIVLAVLASAAVVTWASPGWAGGPTPAPEPPAPLTVEIPGTPTATTGTDGQRHLVVELLVANRSPSVVQLERLTLRDERGRRLAAHRDVGLADLMVRSDGVPRTAELPPGTSSIVLLDVGLGPRGRVPAALRARVVAAGDDGAPVAARAAVRVDRRAPVRIRPPLRGDDLMILGCCGRPFAHRAAPEIREGTTADLVFAQRYAIDVLQLGEGLATAVGDPSLNESYLIHGDDVLAVAPGRVVAVRDGMPENTPPTAPPAVDPVDLAGNRVVQDLGDGRFALYAHLQPGSVTVTPGDRVWPGQVLGRVGNTGNSTEPHLHFHVMDGPGGPSGVAADGLPYAFDRFRLDGLVTGLADDPPNPQRVPAPPHDLRRAQYPLTGDVISLR